MSARWPTPDHESWRGRIHAALWPVLDGYTKAEAWLIIDSAVPTVEQFLEAEANVRWARVESVLDRDLCRIESDALGAGVSVQEHPQ